VTNDCWNRIGIRGDASCPELARHIHCRNCEVYAAAAQALLDRPRSITDIAERTRHVAQPKIEDEPGAGSVLIFRIGVEWLALPTEVVQEVIDVRSVHSLPHRRGGAVLGVTNVRGELVVTISLSHLLGLGTGTAPAETRGRLAHKRFLVMRREEIRAVCPADEVHGIHRFNPSAVKDAPATVARSAGRFTHGVLEWLGHTVGMVDARLLFDGVERSLA
jgi:chemotaxis-related protein WspD